jgi:hypothetical protein
MGMVGMAAGMLEWAFTLEYLIHILITPTHIRMHIRMPTLMATTRLPR